MPPAIVHEMARFEKQYMHHKARRRRLPLIDTLTVTLIARRRTDG